MKVMMLFNHLNPGGVTSYLKSLVRGLLDLGLEVVVVSGGGSEESYFNSAGATTYRIPINTSSELNPKLWFAHHQLKSILIRERPDVIHSHSRVSQVLTAISGKPWSKRHVFTCHGYFRRRWGRVLFPFWGRQVIAVSDGVRRHLNDEWNVNTEKVSVIKHGVERRDFIKDDVRSEIRDRFGLPRNRIIIGSFGRYSDVKGYERLIRCASELLKKNPLIYFVIAGSGRLYDDYVKLGQDLKIGNSLRVFGTEDNADESVMQAFDIFCAPSLQEGLGLSIMEAMAYGLPVVASRVGGIPELIDDGVDGILFDSSDDRDLADKLTLVSSDCGLRETISVNARKKVSAEFSLKSMAENTKDVYEKIL